MVKDRPTTEMTQAEAVRLVSNILSLGGNYADGKIKVSEVVDGYGITTREVVIRTAPAQTVFMATSWGGKPVIEFRPGHWCEYLRGTVLPARKAEMFRKNLAARAKADQTAARRNAPVDDAELFGD